MSERALFAGAPSGIGRDLSVLRAVSSAGPSASRKQVPDNECVMSKINWKLIAFIGALWWFIYSAPTEDSLFTMFVHKAGGTSASDDF
jgi:hypothetical protein